jgi:hypothetical protein
MPKLGRQAAGEQMRPPAVVQESMPATERAAEIGVTPPSLALTQTKNYKRPDHRPWKSFMG